MNSPKIYLKCLKIASNKLKHSLPNPESMLFVKSLIIILKIPHFLDFKMISKNQKIWYIYEI